MSEPTRQHYALATGKGLTSAPAKTSNPGMAKGGKAKSPAPKSRPSKSRA